MADTNVNGLDLDEVALARLDDDGNPWGGEIAWTDLANQIQPPPANASNRACRV